LLLSTSSLVLKSVQKWLGPFVLCDVDFNILRFEVINFLFLKYLLCLCMELFDFQIGCVHLVY
jgi:hypothetical protein